MRLVITRVLSGSINGIQLDRFHVGFTYDVETTLGNFLLGIQAAHRVRDNTPALLLPFTSLTQLQDDVVTVSQHLNANTEAAQRRRRPKARKPR